MNWNAITEISETIAEAVAATFLGVGIGVVAAFAVIAFGH